MNTNRDTKGKFQLKGSYYKHKVIRVTDQELLLIKKHRLANKEIAVAVLSQENKAKCFACQGIDEESYISIHKSCFDEFMKTKPYNDSKLLQELHNLFSGPHEDISELIYTLGKAEVIVAREMNL